MAYLQLLQHKIVDTLTLEFIFLTKSNLFQFFYGYLVVVFLMRVFCPSQSHNQTFDLPIKKKSDICTLMYTSGTTGDPKGVMISNDSIITLLAAIKHVLWSCNEQVSTFCFWPFLFVVSICYVQGTANMLLFSI